MRPFGEVDDIVISSYYQIITDDELSEMLGRSRGGIRHRARKLGLKAQNGKPSVIRKAKELKKRRKDVVEVLKQLYPPECRDIDSYNK